MCVDLYIYCCIYLYYLRAGAYIFSVLFLVRLTSFMQYVEILGIFCLGMWNFILLVWHDHFLYKALELLYSCVEFYFSDYITDFGSYLFCVIWTLKTIDWKERMVGGWKVCYGELGVGEDVCYILMFKIASKILLERCFVYH